ncbi:MAG: YgiQ family radical SAM protein [bacterium]
MSSPQPSLPPTTPAELKKLGWDRLDIILVTGDSYIDSSFLGAAVIARVLLSAGYRVGVIAQPDINSADDIVRLGEPRLFWGVSGGAIDSMVANYTAIGKKRRSDDYTPGGRNTKRPDRAVVVYSNLIRQHFKRTVPIVLGGLEASLRRVAHYDFWSNKLRRSVLVDAKADFLIYGMGEAAVTALAEAISNDSDPTSIRGLCYLGREIPRDFLELPSYAECVKNKATFTRMFHDFYRHSEPVNAHGLAQLTDTRYLIQNPPAQYLSQAELDRVYELPYTNAQHPYYERQGPVKALETIRFSITSHRGCYGECNFCAIGVHQGRDVRWRSRQSILREAGSFSRHPKFKGIINDVGGPTANMYGFECARRIKKGTCSDKRCLYPQVCSGLRSNHSHQIALLRELRSLPGVKRVFVASGLRHDMIVADRRHGQAYLKELVKHHVSGQLKLAPEHTEPEVLRAMGKPGLDPLIQFKSRFDSLSRQAGKGLHLTYYLIAAHPGCTEDHTALMKTSLSKRLKINPEQVQIFTPLPSTYSALMFYTGRDPFTGKTLYVARTAAERQRQKDMLTAGRAGPQRRK